MNEAVIMHKIMVAISKAGYKVFRANVGKVRLADGRFFQTGLPKGHPDLYGFRPDGQIFYIEVKAPGGRIRPEQKTFIEAMRKSGALAGIAHNEEEALDIVHGGLLSRA